MDKTAANPFSSTGSRPVLDRLNYLKWRTLLVAATSFACIFFGYSLLASPIGHLTTQVYSLVLSQTGMPPAHVPVPAEEVQFSLSQLAFIAVTAAAIMGHSVGAFGGTRARWVMLLPLLVGIAVAYFSPPTSAWMRVWPSQLERQIMHGQFEEAEHALVRAGVPVEFQPYVQAQIALRANDRVALRRHGELVLRMADEYVFGVGAAHAAMFEPRVVYAIDLALNRVALTEVGMQLARRAAGDIAVRWMAMGIQIALGAGLLLAIWPLLRLWNRMRQRVAVIQEIVSGSTRALTASSKKTAASEPITSSAPAKRLWPGVLRIVVIVALAPMAFWLVWYLLAIAPFAHLRAGRVSGAGGDVSVAAIDDRAVAGTQPCYFVGDWTASRNDSVYKVTLSANGQCLAEPISHGKFNKNAIPCSWKWLAGDKLYWADSDGRTHGRPDVNPVVDRTTRGFTLIEVNGERTRYNRISEAAPENCKK